MKKLITTCVMLTALTMVSFAQSKSTSKTAASGSSTTGRAASTPEQYAEKDARALQTQLGLGATEYTGVYEAELHYYQDAKTAHDAGYEPGPGQSLQMKMMRDQRFKSVMTADHYAKYEASLKK